MQRGAVEVGEGRERAGGIQREGLQKGMLGIVRVETGKLRSFLPVMRSNKAASLAELVRARRRLPSPERLRRSSPAWPVSRVRRSFCSPHPRCRCAHPELAIANCAGAFWHRAHIGHLLAVAGDLQRCRAMSPASWRGSASFDRASAAGTTSSALVMPVTSPSLRRHRRERSARWRAIVGRGARSPSPSRQIRC
jgi:hypothetical protein